MPPSSAPAGSGFTNVRRRLDALDEKKPLTPRELEVAEWIGSGESNKEIAQNLGCSVLTVKTHVHNILDKLRLKNRSALCAWWHEYGKFIARPANENGA